MDDRLADFYCEHGQLENDCDACAERARHREPPPLTPAQYRRLMAWAAEARARIEGEPP